MPDKKHSPFYPKKRIRKTTPVRLAEKETSDSSVGVPTPMPPHGLSDPVSVFMERLLVPLLFVLLVFTSAYFFVYSNTDTQPFSELYWNSFPMVSGTTESPTIDFGIVLHSVEKEDTSYHVIVLFNRETAGTQSLVLFPDEEKIIPFSLPVNPALVFPVEVTVRVTRPAGEKGKERPVLEIRDWALEEE